MKLENPDTFSIHGGWATGQAGRQVVICFVHHCICEIGLTLVSDHVSAPEWGFDPGRWGADPLVAEVTQSPMVSSVTPVHKTPQVDKRLAVVEVDLELLPLQARLHTDYNPLIV